MRNLIGEFVGTFILVFIGCGSVGISILHDKFTLIYIAVTWLFAVALGIYSSRKFSEAHLNPAVSIAMLLARKIKIKELNFYILGQFLGAFFASIVLFIIFNNSLNEFESINNITRVDITGLTTAKMFGEYYQNSIWLAAFAETIGTAILVLMIFILTSDKLFSKNYTPLLIGLVVAILIWFIAPITQAGFNPARDFSPRLMSYLFGWKMAFSANDWGWLIVYIIAPITGSFIGYYSFIDLKKSFKTQNTTLKPTNK